MSPREASEATGIHKLTILKWIRSGKLAAEKIQTSNGIGYDIRPEDLTQAISIPRKKKESAPATPRGSVVEKLDAMEKLNRADIELHVYGGIQGSGSGFEKRKHLVHYHPPVSQYELFQLYTQYDALVLPTIFEGFGLVIVEAMAAGLPVITTANSMGPDVIEDDINGWIIPIRDAIAIATSLEKLRQKSNEIYAAMRAEARNAAIRYSWDRYRLALLKCLEGF